MGHLPQVLGRARLCYRLFRLCRGGCLLHQPIHYVKVLHTIPSSKKANASLSIKKRRYSSIIAPFQGQIVAKSQRPSLHLRISSRRQMARDAAFERPA
jgi:hypothetical protein